MQEEVKHGYSLNRNYLSLDHRLPFNLVNTDNGCKTGMGSISTSSLEYTTIRYYFRVRYHI